MWPEVLLIEVTVSEQDGAVGVTEIRGATTLRVTGHADGVPTVQIVDGVPATAREASVRFRKGEDVWFLGADPASDAPVELRVPDGEVDRFPETPVDWVLVTVLDAGERVVDVSGSLVR